LDMPRVHSDKIDGKCDGFAPGKRLRRRDRVKNFEKRVKFTQGPGAVALAGALERFKKYCGHSG